MTRLSLSWRNFLKRLTLVFLYRMVLTSFLGTSLQTVNSCYNLISKLESLLLWSYNIRSTLAFLWEMKAPSRILIFSWRLIIDMLRTRDQQAKKDVVQSNSDKCYVFCFTKDESVTHLFDSCFISSHI